jgi:hypothetical protein
MQSSSSLDCQRLEYSGNHLSRHQKYAILLRSQHRDKKMSIFFGGKRQLFLYTSTCKLNTILLDELPFTYLLRHFLACVIASLWVLLVFLLNPSTTLQFFSDQISPGLSVSYVWGEDKYFCSVISIYSVLMLCVSPCYPTSALGVI